MSRVVLAHGSGGVRTFELLQQILLSKIPEHLKRVQQGHGLDVLDDGAVIKLGDKSIVVTVDSYTVNPIFFPGGDIGKLAISGTINDLVAMGARPLAVLDSIVVEEGFSIDDLERIVNSIVNIVEKYSIALIGGDLKVMPRGHIDKIVITMVGIGITDRPILDVDLKPGDKIIVVDNIAEHGATILALQQGLDPEKFNLKSDCKPLLDLLDVIEKYREHIHAARDPTRGGLATVLNEWARQTSTLILIHEEKIPIRREVQKFCEMLGVDPLYLACEGNMVLAVAPSMADVILQEIRSRGFENASMVGEVRESSKYAGIVVCKTCAGGLRIVEPLRGEIVPRIC